MPGIWLIYRFKNSKDKAKSFKIKWLFYTYNIEFFWISNINMSITISQGFKEFLLSTSPFRRTALIWGYICVEWDTFVVMHQENVKWSAADAFCCRTVAMATTRSALLTSRFPPNRCFSDAVKEVELFLHKCLLYGCTQTT